MQSSTYYVEQCQTITASSKEISYSTASKCAQGAVWRCSRPDEGREGVSSRDPNTGGKRPLLNSSLTLLRPDRIDRWQKEICISGLV